MHIPDLVADVFPDTTPDRVTNPGAPDTCTDTASLNPGTADTWRAMGIPRPRPLSPRVGWLAVISEYL
jgi:hypothetical protein